MLGESTERMKQFFEREVKRYENRKQIMKKKQDEGTGMLDAYRQMIRELVQANCSFAAKCSKNKIEIQKVIIRDKATSWR